MIGTKLAHYEITSHLGSGGMGDVYQATDSKLGRSVAIKLLPKAFARDADRLTRFEREARVLASLNHPNIAAIYGIEQSGEWKFLVMELVAGETLAERIKRGALPIDEALPIARQIAGGLEGAHEKGIVHRDLKPANIKITPRGVVKVLDFGLAKAFAGEAAEVNLSNSPTMSMEATKTGVILGTAAYMSPEQARGKATDRTTDIWAFGCVLYEMLTSARAFDGDDVAEVLAAVIRGEPDMSKLPVETPPAIRRLLRRCFAKDRRERLPDIGTARLEINDALMSPAETQAGSVVQRRKGRFDSAHLGWSLAVVAALVALGLFAAPYFRAPLDLPVYRASILPPDNAAWAGIPPHRFKLSPDGRRLASLARDANGLTQLWVRSLDGLAAQALAGTAGVTIAFWSPDSRYLAFGAGGKLKKIDAAGGPPLTLADMTANAGGTWNQDDVILFPPKAGSPLHRVSAAGGMSFPVTTLDAESGDSMHTHPFFLPDGRHFLYFVVGSKAGGPNDGRAVYIGSLDSAEKSRLLIEGGSNAQYASGYVFFMREATLMAQPFDVDRLELTGEAMPVAEQIQVGGNTGRSGAFSVSQTGALIYQTGLGDTRSQLTWFDRAGKQVGAIEDQADYADLELSGDGKRAAVSLLDPTERTRDIWLFDMARGLRSRFTFDPADEFDPVWSADGTRIVFNSRRKGHFDLYQKASNGAGQEEILLADNFDKYPLSWSSDGRFIIYDINAATSTTRSDDLWILPLFGDRKPFPYLQTRFTEVPAQFSPDDRWVAYVSNESGRNEVYVSPFPKPSGKWQVSTAGGRMPRWRPDGKEIFYLAPDNTVMAAAVNGSGAAFETGAVQSLFETSPGTSIRYQYDVFDGQRFLVNTLVEEASPIPVTLLVNWPALLEK